MAFLSENLALPDNAFLILRNLIMERTGIYFEENKKDILADKLSERVIEKGFNSFLDYYYLLKYDNDSAEEWNEVIDRITVKETYFWREYDQIDCLLNKIVPDFYKNSPGETFRIWSSACSTGEEPLSILMALEHAGWTGRIKFELIASDASQQALKAAREGLYRERSLRQIPIGMRERYFRKKDSLWQIDSRLTDMIKWEHINLADDSSRSSVNVCNVIFCRNVFIYFKEETVMKIVNGFYSQLLSPGFLFTGVSESLFRIKNSFELIELCKTFVYRKP
jgi:chemotaxis protein methyltransferase CheR